MYDTLDEICAYLSNWFLVENGVHIGDYDVKDGKLTLPFLADGQYYRIIGSIFSDGIHCAGDSDDVLPPESFHGAVWALAIPPAVVSIAKEIKAWEAANAAAVASPYQSESFGGYSYTKATPSGSGNELQQTLTWRNAFADRLAGWKKI